MYASSGPNLKHLIYSVIADLKKSCYILTKPRHFREGNNFLFLNLISRIDVTVPLPDLAFFYRLPPATRYRARIPSLSSPSQWMELLIRTRYSTALSVQSISGDGTPDQDQVQYSPLCPFHLSGRYP
jgi:hypothetical protein